MGYDEHGPAYPEPPDPHPVWDGGEWTRKASDHDPANVKPFHEKIARTNERRYRCPICKGDENRFMTCDYPDCPDGCDQPGRFRTYPATPSKPSRWQHLWVSATVALIVSLSISMCHMARG